MNIKLTIQSIMGTVAFCIWSVMAYYDTSLRVAYLTFVVSVVTTISALVLRDMPNPTDAPRPQRKDDPPRGSV